MTEAQIQLQNALTTTFLANLAFLSEYDNELYHRVDELSRMIEYGEYQEKYALEFIMEDGDFDIYDIVNDKYLYNKKPKKINDDLVRKMEYDTKYSIINIEETFTKNLNSNSDIDKFNIDSIEQSIILTNIQMQQYHKITKDLVNNKKKKLRKIDKLIFAGTLLGRHIPRIAKKLNAKLYFVFEKNLEIFRLSLFTTDYTILSRNGVIFSIMDNENIEKQKIESFCRNEEDNNYLIKVSTTNINIDKFIDRFLSFLVGEKSSIYDYNRKLYVYLNRTTKYLKNNYNFLNFKHIKSRMNFFENKPVLFLAGGPSLDENIAWIQENQYKFFIVTIGATYNKLLNKNIKIDLIITFDEQLTVLETKQFSDMYVKNIPSNTIIFASSMTHENILKKFNKNNLFLYEIFYNIIDNNVAFSGPSVGDITLNILLNMNVKNIYIIGLDLSLNQNTGSTHSNISNSSVENYNLSINQSRETFALREGLIKVKGNLLEEVYTTAIFDSSIYFLNKYVLSKKELNTNIYNLSSHGAYLNFTIPTKIEDINMEKFDLQNHQDLQSLLTNFSVEELNIESRQNIELILKSMINISNRLLELEKLDFKYFEDFLFFAIEFIYTIKEEKNLILYYILKNYYKMLFPYLNYYFNDTKVKEESKKVNMIKQVFISQIYTILNDYKLCLERVL